MDKSKTLHLEFTLTEEKNVFSNPKGFESGLKRALEGQSVQVTKREKEKKKDNWELIAKDLEVSSDTEQTAPEEKTGVHKNEPGTLLEREAKLQLVFAQGKGGGQGSKDDAEQKEDGDDPENDAVFGDLDIDPVVFLTLKSELDARLKMGETLPFTEAQLLGGLTQWMAQNKGKLHLKNIDPKTARELQQFAQRYVKKEKARRDKKQHAESSRALTAGEKKAHQFLQKHGIAPQRQEQKSQEQESVPEFEFDNNSGEIDIDQRQHLAHEADPQLSPKQIEHELLELAGSFDVSQAVGALLLAQQVLDSPDFGLQAATILVEKYATRANTFLEKNICLSGIDMVADEQDQGMLKNTFTDMRATETEPALQSHLATLSGDAEEPLMDARENLMAQFHETMTITEGPVPDMTDYEPYQAAAIPQQQPAAKAAVPPWMRLPSMPTAPTAGIFGTPVSSGGDD